MRTLALCVLLTSTSAFAQSVVSTFPTGGTFSGGVALDPITNEIYVIDQTRDAYDVFTTSGTLLRTFTVPTGTLPIGGFVDPLTGDH